MDNFNTITFLLSLAAPFGWEAVRERESDWRRYTAGVLAAVLTLSAVLWVWIEPLLPVFGNAVTNAASQPVSWLMLFLFAAAIAIFTGPQFRRISPEVANALKELHEQSTLNSNVLSAVRNEVANIKVRLEDLEAIQKHPPQPARPELRLQIEGGNCFTPTDEPSLTGIGLQATVWNTGLSSRVMEWSLSVIPVGATPALAQLTKMPDQLAAGGPKRSAILRASDALDVKTFKDPVGIDPVSGTLLFYVKLPRGKVLNDKTVWELSAKDAFGGEIRVSKRMSDWLQDG